MCVNHRQRTCTSLTGLLLIVVATFSWVQETHSVPGVPRPLGVDFTRNLSDQQRAQIQAAINTIAGGPPISFTWNGGNGNQTALGAVIAAELSVQLGTGRIDAKPMGPGEYAEASIDLTESSFNDQMTINSNKLTEWLAPGSQKYLQETLIHEWAHKKQTAAQHPTDNARELDAYRCEMAYKDAIGMGYDDPEYRFVARQDIAYMEKRIAEIGEEDCSVRPSWPAFSGGTEWCILFDSNRVAGIDTLVGFRFGELDWSAYPFAHRASDMILLDESPLLPPGHTLALVCGGVPSAGVSGLYPYDLFMGEVMGMLPPLIFAPPDFPPMFYYSMTMNDERNILYVLDTLGHRIVTFADFDLNGIPEFMISQFAIGTMPGFEILWEARGIDYATRPHFGNGLLVNTNDVHLPPHHNLMDQFWFLPDLNNDWFADLCHPVLLAEFKEILPVAGGNIPWAGDVTANVFGTWEHVINILSADSLGETVYEDLGSIVLLGNVHGTCPLMRPLVADEFILAHDLTSNSRLNLATKVIDPTIRDLTIHFTDGLLCLNWSEVPGATHYELLQSIDGENYFPTGLIAEATEFSFPQPPEDQLYFEVAARR